MKAGGKIGSILSRIPLNPLIKRVLIPELEKEYGRYRNCNPTKLENHY